MKYLQESRKSSYLAATLLGAILVAVPLVAAQAGPSFQYTESAVGKAVNAFNSAYNTTFIGNMSAVTNGTAQFNFVGIGGHDNFTFIGGNSPANVTYLATGSILYNNSFIINGTGNGNFSTFSLISGPNSNFTIGQNNYNGTATFIITAGTNSTVFEFGGNSTAPIGTTYYSINLGTNSTVILSSDFEGNASTVNVVF